MKALSRRSSTGMFALLGTEAVPTQFDVQSAVRPDMTQLRRALLAIFAFFIAFILSIAFTGFLRFLNPHSRLAVQHESFWLEKACGDTRYDLIVFGNSRTYEGIDPDTLTNGISSLDSTYNLALSSSGYTRAIYALIERRLNTDGEKPTLLLGIAPSMLTHLHGLNLQYKMLRSRHPLIVWTYLHFPWLAGPFRPSEVSPVYRGHSERYALNENGWIACTRSFSEAAHISTVNNYKQIFEMSPVLSSMENALLAQVRKWNDQGIMVIGFTPPVSPELREVERTMSQFDSESFIERFRAAGGHWIDVDPDAYTTYDAGHLEKESALRLSADLGEELRRLLDSPPILTTESMP